MNNSDRELEAKLWISQPERLRARLEQQAETIQPRTREINLRFDRPDGSLGAGRQVLRLRQDERVRLTFKGPGVVQQGVLSRQEIEFEVGSFESARSFLEALGYHVQMSYEKYRTTYQLEGVSITLDEMPYGNFVELEGPDPEVIRSLCHALDLDWQQRILDSYTGLFDRIKDELGLDIQDLTFENFRGISQPLDRLDLQPADRS